MKVLPIVLLMCSAPLVPWDETGSQTLIDDFEALLQEYEVAEEEWSGRYEHLTLESPDSETIERYRTWPAWEYAPRFLELAEREPDEPTAFDPLAWVVRLGQQVDESNEQLLPHYERALGLLSSHFLDDPRLVKICRFVAHCPSSAVEGFLLHVSERSPHGEVRGQACLALAELLTVKRLVGLSDSLGSGQESAFESYLTSKTHPSYLEYVRGIDPEASLHEAERLFERVLEQYADVPALMSNGMPYEDARTLADVAAAELHEIRALSLGMVAPEIEGEDLDGRPMRLSDHRGKVVALVSWATWCGPCMGMIPHERELVARLENRPFVLLGINGDEDRDRAKEVIRDEGVTWRSWWDGGPDGPISKLLNIRGWPTIYVLDADGVIRYKQVRGAQLDEAIDTLLGEVDAGDAREP